MPRAPPSAVPRKAQPAAPRKVKAEPAPAPAPEPTAAKVAVADEPKPRPPQEPVWLVRIVLLLFLVGFAAFVAREMRGLLDATGVTRSLLYWSALGIGFVAGGLIVGGVVAAVSRRRA